MPIRKYANARSTDRDSDYSVSEYSANHSVYTETTNNIHSNSTVIQTDSVLQTDSVYTDTVLQQPSDSVSPTLTKAALEQTLTRMQPRYKEGKAKRQNDPLAWRIEKILRRLRPMLSTENFIEVSQEFTTSDPMQRVALADKLEKWLERSLGGEG
jgi:lysyl-tRNA synthetase class II